VTALLDERSGHESVMADIRDYILPEIGQALNRDPKMSARDGARKDARIINSSATAAALTLGAGIHSGLTSPARPWFNLQVPDPALAESYPVKAWLELVTERMRQMFARSNIYNVLHDIYVHLTFGTAAALVLEDEYRVLHGYVLDQGSYALGIDRRGIVNVLYRVFSMTVSQLSDEFGKDNLPVNIQRQLEQETRAVDEAYTVHHLIEPNDDTLDVPEVHGRAFRSIYWLDGAHNDDDAGVVAVRGFAGNPILAARWHLTTGGVYGVGPGRRVLGDVKQLQAMESDKLKAIRKVAEPPIVAPASMKGQPLNTFPGGISYYDALAAGAGKPTVGSLYEVRPDLQALQFAIASVESRIQRGFYNDLFKMLSGMEDSPRMTAREVVERHEEKLIMLGPVLERLHSEMLDALIDRGFSIMLDRGMIPEAPEELQGQELRVEYVSVLATAQRMVGMSSTGQFLQLVGQLASAKPDVLDKLDADQMVDEAASMLGVPAGVVVPDEVVAKIRQQRAQQQAQMQAAAMAAEAAKAAPGATRAVKDLAETPVDGRPALDAIMGRIR
jgi:hypothetical protein